jgi:hypothetical protein
MAKILIGSELGSYAFNKVAQTITFTGFTASLERLLLITDVTNNVIIYQFNDPSKGGSIVNNVLTLDYNTNTVAFNNTDNLQIFYWSEEPQQTALLDLAMSIKRDLQLIRREPSMTPNGLNVNVNGGSLPTVGVINALSSLDYIGGVTNGGHGRQTHNSLLVQNYLTYKNSIIT